MTMKSNHDPHPTYSKVNSSRMFITRRDPDKPATAFVLALGRVHLSGNPPRRVTRGIRAHPYFRNGNHRMLMVK